MKPADRDQLLKEILAGSELSELRQASLQQGCALIRRQRLQRYAVRFCALAFLPLILVSWVLYTWTSNGSRSNSDPSNLAIRSRSIAESKADDVKFITDEELFALFPGRSMALVGKPGEQQLVFLDARRP
jgi:hypothetical protein